MPWMVAVLTWDADRKFVRNGLKSDSLREDLAKKFNMYCPRIRKMIARRGHRVWSVEWLFGRYAFVEKLSNWRDAFRHRAVADVLDGVASSDMIYRFRDMEDSDGFVVLPEDRRGKMRRGDPCRISEGPFAEHVAVYHGMGRRDREVALVAYMGRQVRVEVAAGALVPA